MLPYLAKVDSSNSNYGGYQSNRGKPSTNRTSLATLSHTSNPAAPRDGRPCAIYTFDHMFVLNEWNDKCIT